MKATVSHWASALLITSVLTGCGMIPLQNLGVTRTPPAAPESASDAWAKLVAMDRQSVSSGYLPQEVIEYDLQIAQLITEGETIMADQAGHDKAKARIWSEKFRSVQTKRNEIFEKANAVATARLNSMPHTFSNDKPDPCLSPMGRNICSTQPVQQNGVNYTVGPDGIGANVGGISVGPGGLGGVIIGP